ncbi:MAG: AAA family ATPase, partial [Ruminococcus sp.]|nr:AAA family ATPase [Ruminococcus sp.]
MTVKEEMTTPVAPVGAGAEQSSQNQSTSIIPEINEDFNTSDDFFQQMMNPYYLKTVSMNELYETVFQSRPPIIDGLLYPGVYLFVGAPKFGKSFLMAQLAYHVSKGEPLWNYAVHKSDVLYLALEDNYERIQKRSYRMFGTESIDNLRFAVMANTVDGGLEKQLEGFLHQYPDTRLIIIDTLQKVREASNECSYGNDYQVIARLKQFADSRGICMLIVHHTRKQKADDSFDMISGTNGLLGAADGAFLLKKEKRTENSATLEISGRDQQDQKLYLVRNAEKLSWELERVETELWKEPP